MHGAAIIGTGFIGPVHLEALRRLSVPVMGVLGSSLARSQAAQKKFGLPKAYENFEQVLADKDVTSVHLTVPNRLHFPLAKQALLAGKHVMCEKPLAMDSAESSELVALAARTGLQAGVCYNVRYYPLNLQARRIVEQQELGQLFSVHGSYVQDWLLLPTDYNWRVLSDQGGALRAVADIGTHWIDLIASITGLKIAAVFADLHTIHPVRSRPLGEVETFTGKTLSAAERVDVPIDTEDHGSVLFRFHGGARGSLTVSQAVAGRKNCIRYEIGGQNGALAWDSERPNELWMGRRDTSNAVLLRDPALLDPQVRRFSDYPGGHNEGFPDSFKQLFRSFYEPSPAGGIGYPTFADGHREIVLCEAILRSHKEERWVAVEE